MGSVGGERGAGLDLFWGIGSHHCGGWQVYTLQGRSADGRPRDEVTQQPKAVGWQNYLFLGGTQSSFKGLQLIRWSLPTFWRVIYCTQSFNHFVEGSSKRWESCIPAFALFNYNNKCSVSQEKSSSNTHTHQDRMTEYEETVNLFSYSVEISESYCPKSCILSETFP